MCDTNSSRFFRPWSGSPCSSPRIMSDNGGNTGENVAPIKREEDNESVTSVSTYGDYSTGNSSDPEVSSNDGTTKRVRHRSESSVEATSSSSSTHSDDVAADNSLHRLSKFVLASPTMNNFPVAELLPNPSACSAKGASFSTNDCSTPAAVHPMDYLQRIALHSNTFGALNDTSNVLAMTVGPVPQASTIATTGQPFCYDYPRLAHFDGNLYGSSMQQAVDLIHRQDAAAKQMKKLRPKKFRCEHCDVAFSNNGQLKGHIRIHTGERPFKCDAEGCGKSFTRNEELTRHKRIHTGLRPHVCVMCGKCFGRKDHLKKHMRTHENRDPYRLSASAFSVYGIGHAVPPPHIFPPYMYPI